jgi:5,10-methylenetetrahydromethanopterin reductase
VVVFGTVLDEGEDATSPRAQAAAAHAVAVKYHTLYERGGPDQVDQLPGGGLEASDRGDPCHTHIALAMNT